MDSGIWQRELKEKFLCLASYCTLQGIMHILLFVLLEAKAIYSKGGFMILFVWFRFAT